MFLLLSLRGGPELVQLHLSGLDHCPELRGVSGGLPGEEDDILSNFQDDNFLEDTAGCVGWTWMDGNHSNFPERCLMFSRIGYTTPYQNSVRQELNTD